MSDDKKKWLICRSVANYTPPLVSWQDHCAVCGDKVWRAVSSPPDQAICIDCAEALMAEDKDAVIINGPTSKQLADIRSSRARGNN